jgi:F-type H+-transporting ATPase subunit a
MEHQLWFTALLNKLLAGVVTPMLTVVGFTPSDPRHPIPDYVAMQILVLLILVVASLVLRRGLSVENPGAFQQAMEELIQFVQSTAREIVGHGGERYVPMLGTLFLFVLLCNLLGLIPTFQTPTALIQVTFGCSVVAFVYYNFHGVREKGPLGYLKHIWGPIWWMGFLMFPIEIFSNLFRMLSLSVRLYANMFVGDILERVFTSLVPIAIPAIFAALHIFVSVLQAYIFMLLPAIYISMAVSEEH